MTLFKVEHLETHGWEAALRGMRNPMQSHDLSDSLFTRPVELGPKDFALALKLVKAGPSHRKFLRFIDITCDITACLKWWDEFDTYLHTVKNSTSQMHKLGSRELTPEDFSFGDCIDDTDLQVVETVNKRIRVYRGWLLAAQNETTMDAKAMQDAVRHAWRKMVDSVPQSFLYTRMVHMNYEVFLTMYPNRKEHKMVEWKLMCDYLRRGLPYMDGIINAINSTKTVAVTATLPAEGGVNGNSDVFPEAPQKPTVPATWLEIKRMKEPTKN